MNFCPNCGEKLVGKKKFCSNCGFGIQDLSERSIPTSENSSKANLELYSDDVENFSPPNPPPSQKPGNGIVDKTSKTQKKFILPETYNCTECGVKLELEDQERREGKFICPKCNADNEVNPSSKDSNNIEFTHTDYRDKISSVKQSIDEISESENRQISPIKDESGTDSKAGKKNLILPESFNCPKCGIELLLEKEERLERKFTCPNCSSDVSIPSNSKILVPSDLEGVSPQNSNISSKNKQIDSSQRSSIELAFEDKAWIFLGSMISMGLVGFGMFIKYRIDGFKKKSNQAIILALLGFLALFFFGLFRGIMGGT